MKLIRNAYPCQYYCKTQSDHLLLWKEQTLEEGIEGEEYFIIPTVKW